ncbi:MAG: type II toxin-antitoxin system VapC family toxin [Verrucomicrobiota bacterium]
MRGIDTNILLRFLIRDDEAQAQRAAQILTEECTESSPGFLTSIALVELVWTLSRVYKYPQPEITKALTVLLNAKELRFEYPDETHHAIQVYSSGSGDFADTLLGNIALRHGCLDTLTFDQKAARLEAFASA